MFGFSPWGMSDMPENSRCVSALLRVNDSEPVKAQPGTKTSAALYKAAKGLPLWLKAASAQKRH